MGLLNKLFRSGKDGGSPENGKDLSYISEIASAITSDNPEIMEKVRFLVGDTYGYVRANGSAYECIDTDGYDTDVLCWIELISILGENGYLFASDYKCESEDFLWGLKQLKAYGTISDVVSRIELDEDEDVAVWCGIINKALNGRYCICGLDSDNDSYELIIADIEMYRKISGIAEKNGHSIKTVKLL